MTRDPIIKDAQAEMVAAELRKLVAAVDAADLSCEEGGLGPQPCDCKTCALNAANGNAHVVLAGMK